MLKEIFSPQADRNVVFLVPRNKTFILSLGVFSYFCKDVKLHKMIQTLLKKDVLYVGDFLRYSPSTFQNIAETTSREMLAVEDRLARSGLRMDAAYPQWNRPKRCFPGYSR